MTSVYSVSHADGTFYVPTKAEALRAARELRDSGDLFVRVVKLAVTDKLGRRALYCALLNGESFAAKQEDLTLEVPV